MQIDIVEAAGGTPAQRQTTSAWDGNVGMGVAPKGATSWRVGSGNQANNPAVATQAAAAGKTNYLQGVLITGLGATAAAAVAATIAGLLGTTMLLNVAVPAGVTTGVGPILLTFPAAIPGSAVNTAITATLPALGAGNTNASIEIWGYTQ